MTNICKFSVVLSSILIGLAGCSSQGSAGESSPATTVQGQLALSTFANSPSSVSAVDEQGKVTSASPEDSGDFTLELKEGHSYSLEIKSGDTSEPIVFARKDGSLTKTFKVTSASAHVDLGVVRHHDEKPAEGFAVRGTAEGDDADCEDGVDTTTGAVCIDDDSVGVCIDGDGTEVKSEVDDSASASETTETDDEIDVASPMAVPEHNVPMELGGCSNHDDSKDEVAESERESESESGKDAAGGATSSESNETTEAGSAAQ